MVVLPSPCARGQLSVPGEIGGRSRQTHASSCQCIASAVTHARPMHTSAVSQREKIRRRSVLSARLRPHRRAAEQRELVRLRRPARRLLCRRAVHLPQSPEGLRQQQRRKKEKNKKEMKNECRKSEAQRQAPRPPRVNRQRRAAPRAARAGKRAESGAWCQFRSQPESAESCAACAQRSPTVRGRYFSTHRSVARTAPAPAPAPAPPGAGRVAPAAAGPEAGPPVPPGRPSAPGAGAGAGAGCGAEERMRSSTSSSESICQKSTAKSRPRAQRQPGRPKVDAPRSVNTARRAPPPAAHAGGRGAHLDAELPDLGHLRRAGLHINRTREHKPLCVSTNL